MPTNLARAELTHVLRLGSVLDGLRNNTLRLNNTNCAAPRRISGKHARVYMYKDGLYNPYRPLDGFLEGELLLMVGLLALVVSDTYLPE